MSIIYQKISDVLNWIDENGGKLLIFLTIKRNIEIYSRVWNERIHVDFIKIGEKNKDELTLILHLNVNLPINYSEKKEG